MLPGVNIKRWLGKRLWSFSRFARDQTAEGDTGRTAAVGDSTMLQASTVERMDILTKMFTYELIKFILIMKLFNTF